MNIFSRVSRVKELETEVKRLQEIEQERDRYRKQLFKAEEDLREVLTLKENIPKDCHPGAYCRSCDFSKRYYYGYNVFTGRYSPDHHTTITGYMCNKANICKNFVQRKD